LLQNGNILVTEPVKIRDGRNNSSGTLSLAQINLSNLSNIGANVLITSDNLMLLIPNKAILIYSGVKFMEKVTCM
jgi:hypothetical protein